MPHLALHGGPAVRTTPFPSWPIYTETDAKAVGEAVLSGKWGCMSGERVSAFANRFADMQHASHGVCVTNGTTALVLALQAVGVGPGDEVIVPAYTFIATANAVLMCNGIPVYVDIDPETYNLDPALVEQAITPRTKALMPVHFAGLPADMEKLLAIARKHGLALVEDCAQAHGAQWNRRGVGPIGDIGGFSFQSSKNLNAGEGGIILTNDDKLGKLADSLANCGRSDDGVWYGHYRLAGNHRMTELQGALLMTQMERFEEQTNRRHENGEYLTEHLRKIDGIRPCITPAYVSRHARHLYVFRYRSEAFGGASKTRFVEALRAEGIPASPGYSIPLYKQPVFMLKNFGSFASELHRDYDFGALYLPETERACNDEAVWFTQSVLLGEKSDMDDIVRAVAKIRERRQELAER
ncbi:MAG: DegT/DnrJ/EryC1/StrS family aminotransferase [candidate division Zixibacteria bacterium]|nr:DegT/DnrJ/EryC1/StrS family aminotransferase [candidate division Zixibacteria bacterium]